MVRKPLSIFTYYLRNKRKAVPVVILLVLAVFIINVLVNIIGSINGTFEKSFENYKYITQVDQGKNGKIDEATIKKIKALPVARKVDLEKKIKEAEKKEKSLVSGHQEEIKYGNFLKSEYERINPLPSPKRQNNGYLEYPPFEWYEGQSEYVDKNMPKELHNKYLQWKDAHDKLNDLIKDKDNIATWAKNEAIKEVTLEAKNKRNLFTYLWIALESILLICSVILYVLSHKLNRYMRNEVKDIND